MELRWKPGQRSSSFSRSAPDTSLDEVAQPGTIQVDGYRIPLASVIVIQTAKAGIASSLSLAQLEERETVTVQATQIVNLKALGSIPRGETFLFCAFLSVVISMIFCKATLFRQAEMMHEVSVRFWAIWSTKRSVS